MKFGYVELGSDDQPVYVIMSEDEILESYWSFWSSKMIDKFGEFHPLITKLNCISDWVLIHMAEMVH